MPPPPPHTHLYHPPLPPSLPQALGLLLEAGVSSLPVVDAGGALLDIYARADITTLAKVRRKPAKLLVVCLFNGHKGGPGVTALAKACRGARRPACSGAAACCAWRCPFGGLLCLSREFSKRERVWGAACCTAFPPGSASHAPAATPTRCLPHPPTRRAPTHPPTHPACSPACLLSQGNAYARLQFEDVTVGQALSLGGPPLPPPQAAAAAAAGPPQWGGSPRGSAASLEAAASGAASSPKHLHLCTPHDALRCAMVLLLRVCLEHVRAASRPAPRLPHPHGSASPRSRPPPPLYSCSGPPSVTCRAGGSQLPRRACHYVSRTPPPPTATRASPRCRTVVERLSVPGVRRLVVVDSDTRRVEGIISLSDVASYLLL